MKSDFSLTLGYLNPALNNLAMVFFRNPILYLFVDMLYFSSFLTSIFLLLAFTILKFINGIPFSSL